MGYWILSGSDWPGGLPGDSRWAGGPVGEWGGRLVSRPGGQQNYYDIIFCWPLILSIIKKQDCSSRVVMAKRHR